MKRSYAEAGTFTFAIIDKNDLGQQNDTDEDEALAGMVSLVNANVVNMRVDIGLLHIIPSFQSRGFGTRVAKLLLDFCMSDQLHGGRLPTMNLQKDLPRSWGSEWLA